MHQAPTADAVLSDTISGMLCVKYQNKPKTNGIYTSITVTTTIFR
jgi:hypothetical protein